MKTGCPAALAEEPRADPGAGLEAVGGTRLRSGETRHMRSYRRPPRILDEHDREVPGDRICTIKADRQSTGMKAHARGWRPIEPSWFTPPGVGRKSWPRPLSGDPGHYRNMTDALRSILQTTGPLSLPSTVDASWPAIIDRAGCQVRCRRLLRLRHESAHVASARTRRTRSWRRRWRTRCATRWRPRRGLRPLGPLRAPPHPDGGMGMLSRPMCSTIQYSP